jgi:hypothetical protein
MKVFLAGIIQGSIPEADIHEQDWREPIRRALARCVPRADVYCHYSEHPNSITYGPPQVRATLADGFQRAAECDVLVAYVPSASMGTAIEMYLAAEAGAVVLTVTPLKGNWVVLACSDRVFGDTDELDAFLAAGELEPMIERKARPKG